MGAEVSAQILAIVGRESVEQRTIDFLNGLESLQKPDVARLNTRHIGQTQWGQSKIVNAYFTKEQVEELETLELVQLTDMQFGHKSCKLKRVIEWNNWILEKPNRFVLMTGDNIDAATAKSPGSPWDNWFEPQSEVYKFCKMMSPIRHRILGYVGGNHERRGIPAFGDLGFMIATLLKLPYSAGQQLVNVNFGKHRPFKIHLWHGLPRARTKGALAQIIDRYMQQGDSQLYLTGHNHQALVIPQWRMFRDDSGGMKLTKIIGASGTSFLEFWGTYAEIMGLSASDVLMPRVILYPQGSWELTLR
jgi:hypothetical protein